MKIIKSDKVRRKYLREIDVGETVSFEIPSCKIPSARSLCMQMKELEEKQFSVAKKATSLEITRVY